MEYNMNKNNFESLNFKVMLRRSYLSLILPAEMNKKKNKINDDIRLAGYSKDLRNPYAISH
jgi:hypothetical protein